MRYLAFALLLVCYYQPLPAQTIPSPTVADDRMSSVQRFEATRDSFLNHWTFENIGPTVMSGRVVDLAVDPQDPTHFYVAYASGGLWETTNNGASFSPIFDHEIVMTIGAIAVNWTTKEIWVGTGEVNSSRSSYAGTGVYLSNDNGKTWIHRGLLDSHHIGRIILDPTDANIVYVAVLGHLYSDNAERGVFKSSDKGQTWSKTLFINNKTGVVDLKMDPNNSDILYAAAWQRERSAWNFVEAGDGSGLYKSADRGNSWVKINTPTSGFPTGEGVGRIGISISDHGETSRIFALLDNYNRRPADPKNEKEGLQKEDFKTMTKEGFEIIKEEDLDKFLKDNGFPKKYSAKSVKADVASNKIKPSDLAIYLEDANSLLFDTDVVGAELYYSDDEGASWHKTHEGHLDGVYFTYGYYFGVITAHPTNPDEVYIAGVPILRSTDGGKTFKSVNGENVHVDHHIIWINPEKQGHIINGNDGGINISYDSGENWYKCNTPAVGQFYYINVDMATPYRVYGGLQDNGVWRSEHTYSSGTRWHNTGRYPYEGLMGGDGMQVQIDTRDNETVYTGFQFGNYFRIHVPSGARKYITPTHELGERPYRWNWQAPIIVSVHNQDIVYMGANKVFRSMNRGDNFMPISQDLTAGGSVGDVPFGTLSTLHESPLSFGLLYTGSDDGLVHVSKDAGYSWTNVTDGLPAKMWISRVQASAHKASRVYASLNGYRWDHFDAYVYVSEDYGQHWDKIGLNLPAEPVNVIKEDPHHEDIIYVGTDRASYISLDRGKTFHRMTGELPNVPVHDIVVHPRDKDLLIGTHGRSIYKADLEALYALHTNKEMKLALLDIPTARYRSNIGNKRSVYQEYTKNDIDLNVISPSAQKATLTVSTDQGVTLYNSEINLPKGISKQTYSTMIDVKQLNNYLKALGDKSKELKASDDGNYYLMPGKYKISLKAGTHTTEQTFEIK